MFLPPPRSPGAAFYFGAGPVAERRVIFGLSGPVLTADERDFFLAARPWGFILFGRNCADPASLPALTDTLRDLTGRADLPILIDQEGGRVQRLKPPHWRLRPPARAFGQLFAQDPESASAAAFAQGRLIAHDLSAMGITVNCAPCADLAGEGLHDAIGDRSFGADAYAVVRLARRFADGLMAGGVLPVVKHLPGYGRVLVDPHLSLPRVEAPADVLRGSDFTVFRALKDLPLGMTAHAVYAAFDPGRCATVSPLLLQTVVREEIGFTGLLMSDDLTMKALEGGLGTRADSALNAGCDMILHGSGVLGEMIEVAAHVPLLDGQALTRAEAALARLRPPEPLDDPEAAERRIAEAMRSVTSA